MSNLVYFDLETQRTANDAGGWGRKDAMKMSVGVTFSSAAGSYRIYREEEVDDLVAELRGADLVVGFNIVNFDYHVLMGYTALHLPDLLPTFDLLADLEKRIARRPKLENVAQATLGVGKTGDGIDAIRLWREGKWLELAEYCCFDVKVTRLLHEHGAREGEVFVQGEGAGRQRVEVDWKLP